MSAGPQASVPGTDGRGASLAVLGHAVAETVRNVLAIDHVNRSRVLVHALEVLIEFRLAR